MSYLYHHGIIGQKWGVRRFQNRDGSLTAAGKKRRANNSSSDTYKKNSKVSKAVILGTLGAASVAASAIYISRHPEVIAKVVGKLQNTPIKEISNKALNKGKDFVKAKAKSSWDGFKRGINKGFEEMPEKLGKALVVGVGFNIAKRALDEIVGKEEAARIFQANNNKKIDKFWKVNDERDKDDRDEED